MENSILDEQTFKKLISNPYSEAAKEHIADYGLLKVFEKIDIDDIKFGYGESYIENVVIDRSNFKKIDINGAEFKQMLWFKNCSFQHEFTIYDGSVRGLIFINCEFNEGINILNVQTESISIDKCNVKSDILIKGGIYKNFTYNALNEKTHLKINGAFTFIEYFKLSSFIGAYVTAEESIIKLLEIKGDFNSNSRINFKNIRNFEILFDNINNDGKFYLTDLQTENIIGLKFPSLDYIIQNTHDTEIKNEIVDQVKYSSKIKTFLQFYNNITTTINIKQYVFAHFFREIFITKDAGNKPNLAIKYCSLGSMELKGINLSNYDLLILSSDLSNIKLVNTFFPVNQKPWTFSDGLNLYNDLYTSATRQNNLHDRIEYYKAAQNNLYKKIAAEKLSIHKIGSLSAILVSQFYSNHGSNWIRAMLITIFIIAFPLYCLFLLSLDNIQIDISENGKNYFLHELLPYFWEFINPLHRIDFMKDSKIELGNWSAFVDLIARILIGIGVFEMIRSFRKYVRN
ncbi:hypothetical protein [Flavobacterium sp. MK4S-17]|uniref:hypothetical protein n=1 Tax=Flavobacterium sp. MK4S-17 TaxID=2543737 RepID=UPI00135A35FD|nr:hypothetical protein [Flavobacterium sp. MK4S-17]